MQERGVAAAPPTDRLERRRRKRLNLMDALLSGIRSRGDPAFSNGACALTAHDQRPALLFGEGATGRRQHLPHGPHLHVDRRPVLQGTEPATTIAPGACARAEASGKEDGSGGGCRDSGYPLAAQGSISLYGILFDTDKAVIKPESEPTLKEIAKLLIDQPAIAVIVVGHTDSQGAFDYNLDLSSRRGRRP